MKSRTFLFGAAGFAAAASLLQAARAPSGLPTFSDPLSIDNPFHPFVVGRVKHFEIVQGHTDGEVLDTYLSDTRVFSWNGTSVSCRVLQEMEIEDGLIHEISRNYFAQADDGTVYYFGETVDVFDATGGVTHPGGWLVGGPTAPGDPPETATAADPTVYMPDDPEVGDIFKPEDLMPFVDETDEVIKVGQNVSVEGGHFDGCIQIRESSLLSSGTETKWYAPGVGVVKVKEKGEVLALQSVTDP